MELADGRAAYRAVRDAVDHHPARAADPLAAVVLERDWLLATPDQLFVDHVEHFEERHIGADMVGLVCDHLAGCLGILLSPDVEGQAHDPRASSSADRRDGRWCHAVACDHLLIAPLRWMDVLEVQVVLYAMSGACRTGRTPMQRRKRNARRRAAPRLRASGSPHGSGRRTIRCGGAHRCTSVPRVRDSPRRARRAPGSDSTRRPRRGR